VIRPRITYTAEYMIPIEAIGTPTEASFRKEPRSGRNPGSAERKGTGLLPRCYCSGKCDLRERGGCGASYCGDGA